MDLKITVFYLLSAVLIFAALRVITAKNPVHAALYLVLSFFTAGCVWVLLEAEFLAIAIVLIYIGAVMVLFLFVVMMLDVNTDQMRQMFWRYLPLGAVIGLVLIAEMGLVLLSEPLRIADASLSASPADYSNTRALGRLLFTDYVYPFELASVILLVGIIVAVTLTLRGKTGARRNIPSEQIAVRAEDRLQVIKMPSEVESESEAQNEPQQENKT